MKPVLAPTVQDASREDRPMRIASSEISQQSSHHLSREVQIHESLRVWSGVPPAEFIGRGGETPEERQRISARQLVEISARARELYDGTEIECGEVTIEEDQESRQIRLILEALTGQDIRVSNFSPMTRQPPSPSIGAAPESQSPDSTPTVEGWGLAYDFYQREAEEEQLAYRAQGAVQTEDGRSINFTLELNLQRQTVREQNISIRAGDARLIDPLVINLANNSATLDGVRFNFDLTSDGIKEELSFVGSGSGFLALDRNHDGVINDGGELFGPNSGSGFSELKDLDSDGNGWLDENDPLFQQLRIWMKDQQGNDHLYTLSQKGVGAIFLGAAQTPFTLNDLADNPQGQLRETSIFLRENGEPGTIQHLDYLV